MARISGFHPGYPGSFPGQGIKISPYATAHSCITETRLNSAEMSGPPKPGSRPAASLPVRSCGNPSPRICCWRPGDGLLSRTWKWTVAVAVCHPGRPRPSHYQETFFFFPFKCINILYFYRTILIISFLAHFHVFIPFYSHSTEGRWTIYKAIL